MVGVHGDRKRLCYPLLTWCLNRCQAVIHQPLLGNLWGGTCCSMTNGKLQLKHAPAAKQSDTNKTEKH